MVLRFRSRDASPRKAKICRRRRAESVGPNRLTIHLALPASTIYRVLRRHDLQRLDHLDRQTGTPIRRYQRCRSGELVHVDVKEAGAHRRRGRPQSPRTPSPARPQARPGVRLPPHRHRRLQPLAYTESPAEEQGRTTSAFWRRAEAWFRALGLVVGRVLTDNDCSYRGAAVQRRFGRDRHPTQVLPALSAQGRVHHDRPLGAPRRGRQPQGRQLSAQGPRLREGAYRRRSMTVDPGRRVNFHLLELTRSCGHRVIRQQVLRCSSSRSWWGCVGSGCRRPR